MTQIEYTRVQAAHFMPSVHIAVFNNTNPGRTSWAAVWLDESGRLRQLSDVVEDCTNMRAEIIAATAALREFPSKAHVRLICPSQYLLNYDQNLPAWKQRDWRNASGKAVSNSDEWLELDKLACRRTVTFTAKDTDPRSLASHARQVAKSALQSELV
jgi:ribonuclease HI